MSTQDWAEKAEDLAKKHPKQADQLLDRVEDEIEERTGHKVDQQVEQGVDAVQNRYGGDAEQEGRRPRRQGDRQR